MYKKKIIETRERKSCFHAVEKLETMGANCDAISIGRPAFESILVKANRSSDNQIHGTQYQKSW